MNPLVTPAWLAERLDDPNTIILDATLPPVGVTPPVDTHARYLGSHIPGAIFFDINQHSDHATTLPHMLPTPEEFAAQHVRPRHLRHRHHRRLRAIRRLLRPPSMVDAPHLRRPTRLHPRRRPRSLDRRQPPHAIRPRRHTAHRPTTTFHAKLDHTAIKDLNQLSGTLAAHQQVLDARSAARFNGTAPEPRPGISSGHMPGATSLPYTDLVEDGRLKSAAALQQILTAKNIDINQPITTTCGSGVTAAVISLALEIAGAKNTSLYDGSWAEYASQPEPLIEKAT